MGSSVERILKICLNGSMSLDKMDAMPIYGKTLKNLLLHNQESFEAESCYIAWDTQDLPNLFK